MVEHNLEGAIMGARRRSTERMFAAVLLWLLLPTALVADSPREIAQRVSPSVVLLVMEDANGQPLSMGSGFVVREGVLATNMHVIERAVSGYARLVGDSTRHQITGVAASDAARDLVLLAADGLEAEALPMGDSEAAAVGDTVYAVGNPRGLEGTFSAGIISGVRHVGDDSLLQITAPISPGSSGGPVVDHRGQVVGVAVATFRGGQNLNFAIPGVYVSTLLNNIGGSVPLSDGLERRPDGQSIFENIGGPSVDGVEVAELRWETEHAQNGTYSLSFRNQLREPIRSVICLVIFNGEDGRPIDIDRITYRGEIPAGLARRATSRVHGSVQRLSTPRGRDRPNTPVEFRILSFEFVEPDNEAQRRPSLPGPQSRPSGESGAASPNPPSFTPDAAGRSGRGIEAELREAERRLAEAVARIAPAGDGPDLIESRIDGNFEGWDGETIFKLENGQIWQQVTFGVTFTFKFRPRVWIVKTHGAYRMSVEGVSGSVFVKRLK